MLGVSQTSLPGETFPWVKKKHVHTQKPVLVCERYVDTLATQSAVTVVKLSA